MIIDKYKRYQNHLKMTDLYPKRHDKKCACGCERKLTGRKTRWFSKECMNKSVENFFIIKGDVGTIRKLLYERDNGKCNNCSKIVESKNWHADHIIEVRHGGGGCDLTNYQTLCVKCHKIKTKNNYLK